MKQLIYIHGGESFSRYPDFLEHLRTVPIRNLPSTPSYSKWTKRLAEEFRGEYEVFMPEMPNAENAKYPEWEIWFERHFPHLKDGVILVGHSLGAMFLTKYLSQKATPFRVAALILLAGAVAAEELGVEDGGDFIPPIQDMSVIANRVDRVIVMHSTDDFVVPFVHGERLHAAIPGSEFITFNDKNHFLVEEFPEFTELVERTWG